MIKNYFKVALRSIFRNKLTSTINIAGLALALSSALLIVFYIVDELSYDRHHPSADRLYRVTRYFYDQDGNTSLRLANVAPPIGMLMQNDFPEIEKLFRMLPINTTVTLREEDSENKSFREPNIYVSEPAILDVFDVELLEGNPQSALENPGSMMVSDKMAEKYFGTTQVQGKTLELFGFPVKITGVYKSFKPQTHVHPDFLISFSTLNDSTIYGRRQLETNWGNNAFGTYFLLKEGEDVKTLESKFPNFLDNHFGNFAKENFGAPADFVASKRTSLQVQKISDIHLHSHLDDELEPPGNINTVYLMGIIGLFIILIASFNFINLSTAQATKRSKEVGIRKVAGAVKTQLMNQYLSESVLISLFACVLALGVGYFTLSMLNTFTGKSIEFLGNPMLIALMLAGTVAIGILAGLYPAFVISAFKPAVILKGKQSGGKPMLRRALVVMQFSISIILIIATGIIFSQLNYLNNKDLGYAKDQIITLPYVGALNNNYDAFYNALTNHASIKNAGRSSRIPTGRLLDSMGAQMRKGDTVENVGTRISFIRVDHNFFETYNIPLIAGRDFSKDVQTDDSLAYVLNESALGALGLDDVTSIIDQEFTYGGVKGKVIGVVKDFHFESLHQSISPIIFLMRSYNFNNLSVQVAGTDYQQGISHIEKVWREFLPNQLFEYTFLNERYNDLYENELKQSQLFTGFSLLAIFIACLGLFGLATFNTLQRIKEIGIRKVLGASVPNIVSLLSREIVILVLVSNLIAWPVAWYFMDEWLNTFAYRIEMNMLLYALAAFVAIAIALLTVSSQTIKAAMSNPSDTLRYE